jgi:hypothetical protein
MDEWLSATSKTIRFPPMKCKHKQGIKKRVKAMKRRIPDLPPVPIRRDV